MGVDVLVVGGVVLVTVGEVDFIVLIVVVEAVVTTVDVDVVGVENGVLVGNSVVVNAVVFIIMPYMKLIEEAIINYFDVILYTFNGLPKQVLVMLFLHSDIPGICTQSR